MKKFPVTTEPGLTADAHFRRETTSAAAAIVVSERAKRQIGSQASEGKAQPNFVEGFPEFSDGPA
jgi:hypothetical protein